MYSYAVVMIYSNTIVKNILPLSGPCLLSDFSAC